MHEFYFVCRCKFCNTEVLNLSAFSRIFNNGAPQEIIFGNPILQIFSSLKANTSFMQSAFAYELSDATYWDQLSCLSKNFCTHSWEIGYKNKKNLRTCCGNCFFLSNIKLHSQLENWNHLEKEKSERAFVQFRVCMDIKKLDIHSDKL